MSKVSLANIFSHMVGPLFILILFFSHEEAFYFDDIPFVYSFMSLALGDISVKILLSGISEISLPMSPLGLLWCHDLYLSPLSTLNLLLCMV